MKLLLLRSWEGQVPQLLLSLPGDQRSGEGVLKPHTHAMRRMRSVSMGSRNMSMPRDGRLAKKTFETGKQAQEWRLWEPEVQRPASHWQTGPHLLLFGVEGGWRRAGQLVHRGGDKEAQGGTWQCWGARVSEELGLCSFLVFRNLSPGPESLPQSFLVLPSM